jgi:hypothetical protein
MLPFIMQKYILFILFQYKNRSYIKKINGIAISMQTNNVTGKIMILQKIEKRITEFEVTMT